jgi:hypothetical protein
MQFKGVQGAINYKRSFAMEVGSRIGRFAFGVVDLNAGFIAP